MASPGCCNATGQDAGSQGGASVFAFGGFTAAFALGLGLRLAVALNVPGRIRRIEPGTVREPVLMRITGYRAGAGIAHRPMVLDDPRGAPPDRETPRS